MSVNWDDVSDQAQRVACMTGLLWAAGGDCTSVTFWCVFLLVAWKQRLDIEEGIWRGMIMMDSITDQQRRDIHQLLLGQDPSSSDNQQQDRDQ